MLASVSYEDIHGTNKELEQAFAGAHACPNAAAPHRPDNCRYVCCHACGRPNSGRYWRCHGVAGYDDSVDARAHA